jgi:hypothetical protein
MKFSKAAGRILLAWAALVVVQVIAGLIVPLKVPSAGNIFAWLVATDLLVVATLGLVALRSDWQGWKLGVALAAIPFAIEAVNVIEAAVFLPNANINWQRLLVHTLVVYVLAVPLWALIFGRVREALPAHYRPVQSRRLREKLWRFVVSDFSYIILYFLAGSIIWPMVKGFYATQTMPHPLTIIGLQLLLRGPVFVVICLLLVRMLGRSRVSGALAVGAVFTILSGVAPLLMPTPYFPDSVRWVHFFEVTSSNFVFGALVGWMWGQPKRAGVLVMKQAA